jgi:thiol-disulfide isomerase/thioredoxin
MWIFILLISTFSGNSEKLHQDASLKYKLSSASILKIVLTRDAMDTVFVEAKATTNIPRDGSETALIPVSKKGTYYLKLVIDRPNAATLIVDNEAYNVLVLPDDTTQIMIVPEGKKAVLQFIGRNSEVNKYYLSKKEDLGYTDIRVPINRNLTSFTTYALLKSKVDSVTNKEIKYLEKYILKNKLPDWFCQYELSEIRYAGAGFKTQMPNYNKAFRIFNDALPDNYFDFLKEMKIDNHSALFSSRYLWFLDDYFTRDLPYEQSGKLSGYARAQTINSHILSKSKDVLAAEVKSVYYKYLLASAIQYLQDSEKIDSLALSYGVSDYKELLNLKGAKSRGQFKPLDLAKGDRIPDFYATHESDSLYSIRAFENNIIYINFWATWCGPCIQNMPALNDLITKYEKDHRLVFINVCIDSEKDKWMMTVKKNKLKGVNLLTEGTWGDKLKSYFSIQGIPHYTLVGKGNIIVENKTDRAPYVEARIDKLMLNFGQK